MTINSQKLGRSNEQTRWEFAANLPKRRSRLPPCCRGWRPLPSCDDPQWITPLTLYSPQSHTIFIFGTVKDLSWIWTLLYTPYWGHDIKTFPHYWPFVKGIDRSVKWALLFLCQSKQTVERTMGLPVIWDTTALMWRRGNEFLILWDFDFGVILWLQASPNDVNTLRPRPNGRHFADDIL